LEGFEPGRNETFSGPLDVACRHADHALADAITPMHFKKIFVAAEPGEMMPLALKIVVENTTRWSKLSENLT